MSAQQPGLARYARQVQLPQIAEHGQHALGASTVLMIGLGGLGCAAAQHLAGAGVGKLILVDRDTVDLSNLHRQTLYAETDIGAHKTDAAAARLAACNSAIEIESHHSKFTPELLTTLPKQADVVLDCTDNFPSRFAINAACVDAKTPLVSGAAIGWQGQLGVFRNDRPDAACYQCLFPEQGEAAERCEDAGVLGPVVATIGLWQATETLRLLLGDAERHSHWLHWDARSRNIRHHAIPQDPHCPLHGA